MKTLKILLFIIISNFYSQAETYDSNVYAFTEFAKKDITITTIKDIAFGIFITPPAATTCTLEKDGTITTHINCENNNNQSVGVIEIRGSKNTQIQVSGTNPTDGGFTFTPTFSSTNNTNETLTENLDNNGFLSVIVAGNIHIDPTLTTSEVDVTLLSTISVTYN